jgi:hypothetical protein
MNLKAYQTQFLQSLQDHSSVEWDFKNCSKTEIAERFSIYRNSIAGHHFNALKNIFPSLMRLVGLEYFEYMARLYLETYQNTESILHNIGKDFSDFLREQNNIVETLPYLPDFVLLEWRWHQVLQGVNNAPLPPQSFETLVAQGRHFSLPLNAQWITSIYPIFQYWKFSQPDYTGDFALIAETPPECLLLFQRGNAVHLKKIDSQAEWTFLMSLTHLQTISSQEVSFDSFDMLRRLWERGCLQIV